MKIITALRNTIADAFAALVDAGAAGGTITVFTGSAPTHCSDADTGTALSINTFSATAFGAASSGVITANAITDETDIAANGTAGYWRIKDSDGNVVAQGSVATSGADMTVNTTTFVQHGRVIISACTVTCPEGT